MADILDEVLQGESQPVQQESISDEKKASYAEQQKQNREEAYAISNGAAEVITTDGALFQQYLDVQSRFHFFSVNNALLVQAQMPEATQLKEFNDWKKDGAQIKGGSKGMWMLKAGKPYQGNDGKMYTPYNARKVFDISQTTATPAPAVKLDDKVILKALMDKSSVPILPSEEALGGARYLPDSKEIHVQRGMNAPDLIRTVSMELVRAQLDKQGELSAPTADFRAYAASYMLCKRYGVDTKGYAFDNIPQALRDLDSKETRKELSAIRDVMNSMDKRMYRNLHPEKAEKQKAKGAR